MKSKFFSIILSPLILTLSACSPFAIAQVSGNPPTPVVETVLQSAYQALPVEAVQVEIGVGSPIPVFVNVSGSLPDSCAQIELVQQQQDGAKFVYTLSTVPSKAEGCIQDSLPFKIRLPLNMIELPAGSYNVEVNGTLATYEFNTGNTTSKLPQPGVEVLKDDIQVDHVEIETGTGSPIPVHAIADLSLPNTCAQLGEIRLHRDGTTFFVRLIAYLSPRDNCKVDSIPFRVEIPLNIVNLPEGPYEVNVNGATASFDPRTAPAASNDNTTPGKGVYGD